MRADDDYHCTYFLRHSTRSCLPQYFGLTLLILLIQLVLAIVGYVYRDEVPQFTAEAWDDAPDSTRDAIQQQVRPALTKASTGGERSRSNAMQLRSLNFAQSPV